MKEKQEVTIDDYQELSINLAHTQTAKFKVCLLPYSSSVSPLPFQTQCYKTTLLKRILRGGGRLQLEDGVRKDKLFPFEG